MWDEKVNVDIDDMLIGWAMKDIDGSGNTLGCAGKKSFQYLLVLLLASIMFILRLFINTLGPVYSRGDDRTYQTAISGIMKFDIADFQSKNLILLFLF